MFLVKNGRLHIAGASFALAEGMYLNTMPDIEESNCILFESSDNNYTVELRAEQSDAGAKAELNNVLHSDDSDMAVIENITPVTLNGLTGYYSTYGTQKHEYYEAIFDLDRNNDDMDIFAILVTAKSEFGIKKALESEAVKRCMNSVRNDLT